MIGNIDILVKELCKLPKEVGWVEFKHNNCEPTMVGEDISALANSATLNDGATTDGEERRAGVGELASLSSF